MAYALSGRSVLVAEDEYYLASDLESALRAAGAIVMGPVSSVGTALDLLDSGETPDAAVLDVNLGGSMAYPVADALAARGVPFLFTTGYEKSALSDRYAAVRRLEKPVEVSVIRRELERLLDPAMPGSSRR